MSSLYFRSYSESKPGVPLFCIHTVPLDGTYFDESLRSFDMDRPVYVIDLPNHGKSVELDEESLDFEHMADSINELRAKLGLEQVTVLGHGIGGFVALYYAIKHQAHLSSLILVNSAADFKYRSWMAWNIRDRYSKITKQALEGYYGKDDDASVKARFTQSFAVYFKPTNYDMAKNLMDEAAMIASTTYVHLSRYVIPKYNVREKIRKIKVPTLLIASLDDVWPIEAVRIMRNDILHAKYIELQTGHFPMIDEPKMFWNTIISFLNQ